MAPTMVKPKVIANAMSTKFNMLRYISIVLKDWGDPLSSSHSPLEKASP